MSKVSRYRKHRKRTAVNRSAKRSVKGKTGLYAMPTLDTPKLATKAFIRQKFKETFRRLADAKRWRQRDVVQHSKPHGGLTRNAVSIYWNGTLPNNRNLRVLADTLGVEPTELLPHYIEAYPRDSSSVDFTTLPDDPGHARLRINRIVPTKLALKIISLIEAENDSAAVD